MLLSLLINAVSWLLPSCNKDSSSCPKFASLNNKDQQEVKNKCGYEVWVLYLNMQKDVYSKLDYLFKDGTEAMMDVRTDVIRTRLFLFYPNH